MGVISNWIVAICVAIAILIAIYGCQDKSMVANSSMVSVIETSEQLHTNGYLITEENYVDINFLWQDREVLINKWCSEYGISVPDITNQKTIPQNLNLLGTLNVNVMWVTAVNEAVSNGSISQVFANILLQSPYGNEVAMQEAESWARSFGNVREQEIVGVWKSSRTIHPQASPQDNWIVLFDLLGTLELGPGWGLFCSVAYAVAIKSKD
jgi:hypothetical protein